MLYQHDTIAAISTPQGVGGIAVIRVSGSEAIEIVDKIFHGSIKLNDAESHKAVFGKILGSSSNQTERKQSGKINTDHNLLDEVIVTVFRSPKSYTRENIAEISCHGGVFLSKTILELILKQGARLAKPGEFTFRAYLNGRLDLIQAEAVADIIRAKTDLSLKAAASQLQGVFSQRIKELRQKLIEICSLLELELDFAEEDVEFADREEVAHRIREAIMQIKDLLNTFKRGKILREGARLVIVGKPNVGKSSLLNAFLHEERAIVTDVPGTTRDTIEEQINIRGVLFRLVDTAGICTTQNKIEQEGVNRALGQIKDADILLFLFDASQKIDNLDSEIMNQVSLIRKKSLGDKNGFVAVINKIDLPQAITCADVQKKFRVPTTVEISAKNYIGIKELEEVLFRKVLEGLKFENTNIVVTNIRHKQCLERGIKSLKLALNSMENKLSSEFIALDLREALKHLGEIIGEVTPDDILESIFSKFCIGK